MGHGENKGFWWRRQVDDPNWRIAIVDSADLSLIQKSGPHRANGASSAIYEWLGINEWDYFPIQVKYAIKTETEAVLHAYTCEGYESYGPIPVIHVASLDFRQRPDATRVEVVEELARAYTNVFTIFNHSACGLRCSNPFQVAPSLGAFKPHFRPLLAMPYTQHTSARHRIHKPHASRNINMP